MVTYYWSSRRKTAAEELFSRTIRPADQNKSEPVPTLRIVQWVRTYLFLALSASESMREYPPHLTLHETVDKLEDPMGSYLKLRLRRPHFKSLNFGFVPTPAKRDGPSIPAPSQVTFCLAGRQVLLLLNQTPLLLRVSGPYLSRL